MRICVCDLSVKAMTFDEWNKGKKAEKDTITLAAEYRPVEPAYPPEKIVKVPGLSVWTPEHQQLETFRRQRLVQRPPYKQPGWRPKK